MTTTVPSKLVYPLPTLYLPWINRSSFNHVKIRNSIFSSAKRSGSPFLWAKYGFYHNKTLAYFIRHLKSKFFQNLLISPSPRSFGFLLNAFTLNLSPSPLIHNGSPITSSSSTADVLNQFFCSCFNTSTAPLPPLAHNPYTSLHDNIRSPDFSVTQMKFAVSFLVFPLTLLLVLIISPLLCSTTQLPYFQLLPLNRYFPFRLEKFNYCTYFQIENLFFIHFRLSPNLSTFLSKRDPGTSHL